MPTSGVTEEDILHEIQVKLYPNNLPGVDGRYIARTHSQRGLSIEEVCKLLQRRTSYEGDYNNTVKAVKAYFDEMIYQLCDGFAVNTGYFLMYPNVGGTYGGPKDSHDREKNPVTARYRPLSRLRNKLELIRVKIGGVADTHGYIDEFFDAYTKSTNELISGNDQFWITGDKIKIVDDGLNTDCGIFFVDTKDPSVRLKVTKFLVENSSTKIIGLTPVLQAPASYRVEIVTQFNGHHATLLKKPKTLVSDFELVIT